MCPSVRSTFINIEVALFFDVYCRARPVLTYFRKSILAS